MILRHPQRPFAEINTGALRGLGGVRVGLIKQYLKGCGYLGDFVAVKVKKYYTYFGVADNGFKRAVRNLYSDIKTIAIEVTDSNINYEMIIGE